MTQQRLDWHAVETVAVVGPLETVAPSAIQARRSGRRRVVSKIATRMDNYRNAITLGGGAMTDLEAAAWLGCPLSVICAIRGDWKAYAEHHGRPCPVVAVARIRKDWGSGKPTTRVRWGWAGSEI